MIGQIVIELAIFPVLGALWLSVVRRIDRLEVKMDKSTERMARFEFLVSNENPTGEQPEMGGRLGDPPVAVSNR